MMFKKIVHTYLTFVKKYISDVSLLGVRALLAVGFFGPAMMKVKNIHAVAQWFQFLKIPVPTFTAYLVTGTELIGMALLILGLVTEFISIPLIIILLVAILTVHMDHGWLAIASSESAEIAQRMGQAKDLLMEHANYDWITAKGNLVILNNGMEFPVIYIILALLLVAFGPGKFSMQHLIKQLKSK